MALFFPFTSTSSSSTMARHSSLFYPLLSSNSPNVELISTSKSNNHDPFHKRPVGSRALCRNLGRAAVIRCERRDDGFYMRRCVELARRAIGCTSPNPMVGCVIVRDDGEIVGEGFHPRAGQPHAEVFALRDAGSLAENATAYVTLEPCNHYGRTPPCTEALIHAKVKQVVVGMTDPNPIVASKGVERLRLSGIHVSVGVEEMLCRKLNEAYIHRMLTGKPFAALRYTLSFNGRILSQLGRGVEEEGGYYSRLLQEYDGIIISSNLAKTSSLPMSHEPGAKQPIHIIIATELDSPLRLPFLSKESPANIIVLAESPISVEQELEGIEVVVIDQTNLNAVLDFCGQRGLCSVLLDFRGDDGGVSELLANFYDEYLIQKVVMEVDPVWDGSADAITLAFRGKSLRLNNLESTVFNDHVLIEGYTESCPKQAE
ncbi:riboflavin biosynthesis protein PYRD, chloroplastic [Typha angustifolia]|uniref:riboflavin biosynthesis protein PYRD, chloroplastic n=1 Tax=Typha angustifolia TaxID=59011 RepID=UPI003C30A94C